MKKTLLIGSMAIALIAVSVPAHARWGVADDVLQKLLGGALYMDTNLSINQNQGCVSCHHPSARFADPANTHDPAHSPVSEGSIAGLFGGRNAPSAAYAGFSPVFYYDDVEGLYIGGTFWDGRASGLRLGDPLAEQALGPFLNPVEMALPTEPPLGKSVVDRVLVSRYRNLFVKVCGIPSSDQEYLAAYDCIGLAIGAFERTKPFAKFSSKFDRFWAEQGRDVSTFGVDADGNYAWDPSGFSSRVFTRKEAKGLALFNALDKGKCALCHLTTNAEDNGKTLPPLFTDFTYDNLGIPVNPQIEVLAQKPQAIDYGLGAVTDIIKKAHPDPDDSISVVSLPKFREPDQGKCRADNPGDPSKCFVQVVEGEAGKVKVSSLRNVGHTAPYGHNGFFATLEDITNFYNTRDVDPKWADPEVGINVNVDELGDLGLSPTEEAAIVAFMKTLTDQ